MTLLSEVAPAISPEQEWQHILESATPECRRVLSQAIHAAAPELSRRFYTYMLGHPRAQLFLDHALVQTRLLDSMGRWLKELFCYPAKEGLPLVAHQRHIGEVHARIQVPIYLVAHGARLIKKDIRQALLAYVADPALIECAGTLVSQLMDLALELMSLSYEKYQLHGTREDESYRLHSVADRIDTRLMPLLAAAESEAVLRSDLTQALRTELNGLQNHLSSLFDRHPHVETGRDALTQLLSRRFLVSVLHREMNTARQRPAGFALMLLDLDHFKGINDAHGREAGDSVLQQAAALLLDCVRDGDFVFRYGGEALVAVLVEVDQAACAEIAELVRQRIESTAFPIAQGGVVRITASIGVAMYSGHPDHQFLIRQSDQAMCRAKQLGRNQVVFAD